MVIGNSRLLLRFVVATSDAITFVASVSPGALFANAAGVDREQALRATQEWAFAGWECSALPFMRIGVPIHWFGTERNTLPITNAPMGGATVSHLHDGILYESLATLPTRRANGVFDKIGAVAVYLELGRITGVEVNNLIVFIVVDRKSPKGAPQWWQRQSRESVGDQPSNLDLGNQPLAPYEWRPQFDRPPLSQPSMYNRTRISGGMERGMGRRL